MKSNLAAWLSLLVCAAAPLFGREEDSPGQWRVVQVPQGWENFPGLADYDGFGWYRCLVKIPPQFKDQPLELSIGPVRQWDCLVAEADQTFFNGVEVGRSGLMPPDYRPVLNTDRRYTVPADLVRPGDYNLIAVRVYDGGSYGGLMNHPVRLSCTRGWMPLAGEWLLRTGDDLTWARLPADRNSAEYRTLEKHARLEVNLVPELTGKAAAPAGAMTFWYRKPARYWLDALLIGNGRIGAAVFGGVNRERIQLNEDSLWAGGPGDRNNPRALEFLPKVRELLFAGKYDEAEPLVVKHMLAIPRHIRPYQSLGDLWLELPDREAVADYRRDLDMETGIASVRYRAGDAHFARECFVSAPDQVLVARFTCDKPGMISVAMHFTRELDARCEATAPNHLALIGQSEGGTGVKFEAHLLAAPDGGEATIQDNRLQVAGADSLTLLLAAATSYRENDLGQRCLRDLRAAESKSYRELRDRSIADHAGYFSRVELDLNPGDQLNPNDLPTDERVEAVRKGSDDPLLFAQHFQFGRYLLIASSRPGCLPANLQGLWCESLSPLWNSDYHLNINIQMDYWPAEVTNLAECVKPLIEYTDSLREPGRRTARVHYDCRGFVAHHLSDIWGFTAPADGPVGLWPMGAAWLCQHLWEHYAFGQDRDYLAKQAYPIMKEAAEFLLDFLVEDDQGRLVTNPSMSPEHPHRTPGGQSYLCVGATMDLQIIHDLFTHCIEASELLGTDEDFRARLAAALERLARLQVGQHGQLQEWLEDLEEHEPGHRHLSHLFAFYPGNQITLRDTPELARAVRVALQRRIDHGGGGTGKIGAWGASASWAAAIWARFEEGDLAYDSLNVVLRRWTRPSLRDTRRTFQIGTNLSWTAAVAEMLLHSHAGELSLLPALPGAWPHGQVRGLRGRGGFEVDMKWKSGKLTSATIRSHQGGRCRVRTRGNLAIQVNAGSVPVTQLGDNVIEFATKMGQTYHLSVALQP